MLFWLLVLVTLVLGGIFLSSSRKSNELTPIFRHPSTWNPADLRLPPYPSYTNLPSSVLVVGACGGLGNHIVRMLFSAGVKRIIGFDLRKPTFSIPSSSSPQTIQEFENVVVYVQGSATDQAILESVIKEYKIEAIVCAIMPDLLNSPTALFHLVNVDAVEKVVKAATNCRTVKKLVHISSMSVTDGFVTSRRQKETDPLPEISSYKNPYDLTKRLGENLVLAANTDSLRTIALRPGGVHTGPYCPTFVFYISQDPIVFPPSDALISYTHGIDAAHAVGCALSKLETDPQTVAGNAYFVGGDAASIRQTLTTLAKYKGIKAIPLPYFVAGVVKRAYAVGYGVKGLLGLKRPAISTSEFMFMADTEKTLDSSKAERELGWKPLCTMDEAIRAIVLEWKADRTEKWN